MDKRCSDVDFREIPLRALSTRSIDILSVSLNKTLILPTHERLARDWRGLLALLKFNRIDENILQQNSEKIRKIIEIWTESYAEANFKKLLEHLERIERFDVCDDVIYFMERDAQACLTATASVPCVANGSVTTLNVQLPKFPENHIITSKDLSLGQPQVYDAFVLYSSDDDHMGEIETIIENLESQNLSLCIKERDFLAGIEMEHNAVMEMIANRCFRVIIFVSKKFLSSPYNVYISLFTQRFSIDQRCRKIIPILMERVELPLPLKYLHHLKHYTTNPFTNFYETLGKSLKTPKKRIE